ncbi:MAG: alpha-glucosidase [Spirochaetales bacterium]|uniref:Alpha-glucosidase n=1 Tax=Candidatus Thalassospirochaeta sargassi TaxID=3119039 RepID=A0AAJ1ILK1_9SPIO|nr:alpha-glucosidase [Spirochaetales bacterium]
MNIEIERKWWKESVVYQIYPRSFYDSNGDGIGDLRGIIEKIDYIASLGVDVIWLNPVYKSPNDDNGYDISDYRDIMDEFGTMADWVELLDRVHQAGMKLIMDLVVNHTSDEHEWFIESRSSLDNEYRDYYIWRDGIDGNPPNDWLAHFSGSAWEFDEKTGQYFLHLFTRRQPDLNWENEKVRAGVHDIMKFWLEKGIDGFRIDTINMFSKVPGLPPVEAADGKLRWGGEFFMNGPRIHEFIHEMNEKVLAGYDVMTVGECPDVTPEMAIDYVGPERKELNMLFQFEHMSVDHPHEDKWDIRPFDLVRFKEIISKWQIELHGRGWNSNYLMNHDQPRSVSRFGDDGKYRVESAKMLLTFLMTLEGTTYIYQGEEIGMINSGLDRIEDYRDVEVLNHYKEAVRGGKDLEEVIESYMKMSRDNSRTPMQWSKEPNAGFSTVEPWIKPGVSWREINVENDLESPDSIIKFFRQLVKIRKENLTLIYGEFEQLMPDDQDLFIYRRFMDDEVYLSILNFSADNHDLTILPDHAQLLLGNYNDETEWLRPYEARIYRIR